MKKIIMVFRNGYEKWLRRRRRRAIGKFRRRMEEAYPDGAEFLSRISAIPKGMGFMLDGGFASTSYVSARGINMTGVTMNYEELKELLEKYPGWQVSVPSILLIPPTQGFYTEGFKSARGANK